MSTPRMHSVQHDLSLAAYDAAEAARVLRRIDEVMDAGGWGSKERDDLRVVLQRLDSAADRVRGGLSQMTAATPLVW